MRRAEGEEEGEEGTHNVAAAVAVDDEEAPGEAEERLDDAEHASREESGVGARDADRLEDGRGAAGGGAELAPAALGSRRTIRERLASS